METGEEMGLAQYLLTKEARSKMYEMFDQLSQASKARIGRAGMLRSENQVMSGITRGNEALIKKHNIPVHYDHPHTAANGYSSFGNNKIQQEFNTFTPAEHALATKHPIGKAIDGGAVGLHFPSDPANHAIAQGMHQHGLLQNPSDIRYADPHMKRHEIYEWLDKVNDGQHLDLDNGRARSLKGEGITGPAYKGTIRKGYEIKGEHNSLGVLAKERKLREGFSYTQGAQIMERMRTTSGENRLMGAVLGRDFSKATLTPSEIRRFSAVSPHQTPFASKRTRRNWMDRTDYTNSWDIMRADPGSRHQEDITFPKAHQKETHAQRMQNVGASSRQLQFIGGQTNFWDKTPQQLKKEKLKRDVRKL